MSVYIVLGVSGVGKSTIGKLLGEVLELPHYDADDYHPKSNVDKMSNGQALTDEDRLPWLNLLADEIKSWSTQGGAVLSCSALKESYREILSAKYKPIRWVYLHGTQELISERMMAREDHFMGVSLLDSQFQALEEPQYGCKVSIALRPNQIIKEILNHNFHD